MRPSAEINFGDKFGREANTFAVPEIIPTAHFNLVIDLTAPSWKHVTEHFVTTWLDDWQSLGRISGKRFLNPFRPVKKLVTINTDNPIRIASNPTFVFYFFIQKVVEFSSTIPLLNFGSIRCCDGLCRIRTSKVVNRDARTETFVVPHCERHYAFFVKGQDVSVDIHISLSEALVSAFLPKYKTAILS